VGNYSADPPTHNTKFNQNPHEYMDGHDLHIMCSLCTMNAKRSALSCILISSNSCFDGAIMVSYTANQISHYISGVYMES